MEQSNMMHAGSSPLGDGAVEYDACWLLSPG
jgi:hypothetical protein